VGLNQQQPDLLSEASERQRFSRFSDLILMAFLAVGAALLYLNTLGNGFISDDEMQVLQNPYIRNLHYLAKIFTTPATSHIGAERPNYYRPLMNVGYLLCYQVFGLRASGFHLANVVLHVAVVCAVFLLTQRMFQNRNLAIVAAAFFALHPIHSEAVAWIAASPDLELSLFYLLTFWFFLGVARPEGRFSYLAQLAMAGSYVLTILSKEPAVTLPLLAMVYEHFYRADREETKPTQKVQRYAVLWLLTVGYLLFRVRVLGGLSSGWGNLDLSWYQAFLSPILLVGEYLWKFLWPVDLRAFCPFHPPLSLFDPAVIGGLAALAACSALFFFLWRRARPLSFGLLWFLLPLAPALNVRWIPTVVFTERYFYLPSVGLCWILGWGFLRLRARASARDVGARRRLAPAALATAFGILAALCALRIITRNRDWRNNFTLYANTLAACPDAYYIRRDLGSSYWQIGDLDSAEREWRETLKVAPDHSMTLESLGLLYLKKQRYSEAMEFFKEALKFDPINGDAHLYLGVAYMDTHSLELAEPELRTAVSLVPMSSNARNALGELYMSEGRMEEAEEQFRQSIEIEPNIMGYGSLGLIHWQRGEAKLAEQEWREALRLAPNDSSVLNNLGLACSKQGRYAEAVSFFHQAIELQPDDPNPHSNLGIAYEKTGQYGPAETEFRTALSLDANDSQAHFQLGALYLAQGRRTEALREYQAGLKSDPENRDALAAVEKLSPHVSAK
jgi:Tfp pilus assembly protein PilF